MVTEEFGNLTNAFFEESLGLTGGDIFFITFGGLLAVTVALLIMIISGFFDAVGEAFQELSYWWKKR